MAETFVIVGGGHAGGRAAETLRAEGFDGRVVVIGREPQHPYMRPMLSKEYLRGDSPIDEAYLKPAKWYEENGVELMPDVTATKLSTHASEVTVSSGDRVRYDKLLLATGALPKRLGLPGEDLPGVYHLRTIADCDALKPELKKGRHIVLVGGGWIGLEVAASARKKGCTVTVIGHGSVPLERAVGPEIGKMFKTMHEDNGVVFSRGTVKGFAGNGNLTGVKLASKTITCDAVVVAVGVDPEVELAEAAGLKVKDGILTNEYFETSVAGVYAAGDVARVQNPLLGADVRIEHWANAHDQGPAAAKNLLGQKRPWDKYPFFFSDQYDIGVEYLGRHDPKDQIVFRGDVAKRDFDAFWLRKDQLTAGFTVNGRVGTDMIEALIKSERKIDPDRLADPDTPLATLL